MSFRLAVLASGGGTTLRNLIEKIRQGQLTASIDLVICSRADAKALQRAEQAGIDCSVVDAKALDVEQRSEQVFQLCRDHHVDLVVMGGFLHLLRIPEDFDELPEDIIRAFEGDPE